MPGLVVPIVIASIVPGDGDQSGQMRQPRCARRYARWPIFDAILPPGLRRCADGRGALPDIDLRQAIETGHPSGPRLCVPDARQ